MTRVSATGPYRRRRIVFLLVLVLIFAAGALHEAYVVRQRNAQINPAGTLGTQIDIPDGSLVLAREALGRLAVQESVSREGYTRDQFSSGWAVVDGCDMRNRILQRDLNDTVLDASDGCTVLSGVLTNDPYTGKAIQFTRGPSTSGAVQIDHVVAVSDSWQKGAQDLTPDERHTFYNDPLNLIAVDGPANMQKGDKDASKWLPQPAYRCRYIARQIAVKLKYYIWITKQELTTMQRVLSTCPSQVLPIETSGAS